MSTLDARQEVRKSIAGAGFVGPANLGDDVKQWLADFQAKHGRPPRLLHIGNIANNAYNNGKLLNQAGCDCDVLCYDYYHVMGCPEWQDADFEGEVAQFSPDWTRVDLKGFRRPKWFVQGHRRFCIHYLLAKREHRHVQAAALWWLLSGLNRTSQVTRFLGVFRASRRLWKKFKPAVSEKKLITGLLLLTACCALALPAAIVRPVVAALLMITASWIWKGPQVLAWTRRGVRKLWDAVLPIKPAGDYNFDRRVAELVDVFRRRFPDRPDKLTPEDCEVFRNDMPRWRALFRHYDCVIGYASDSIYALLSGKSCYVAFEHGTIRDIPFRPDPLGRYVALTYAMAGAIYMTNADSMQQADRLQPSRERIIYGLHGFDERRIDQWLRANPVRFSLRRQLEIPAGRKIFFSPARHHWREGILKKGNDRLIWAAREVADAHPDSFCLVFVEWGLELDLSKELIRQLHLEDYVRWMPTVPKRTLWDAYRTADCVIDQFAVPCFGDCTIEALTVAHCPVITRLDNEIIERFFGATIPLYNCETAGQIAAAMNEILMHPEEGINRARQSRRWIDTWHSHRRVVSTLLAACRTAGIDL